MSNEKTVMFRSKKKESAVDYVINEIQNQLLLGNLKPGDKLPSEDALSSSLGVSRGSVRNAMKVFSACGIMRIQAGDGTYVCTSLGPNSLNPMIFSLLVLQPDKAALATFREQIEYDIIELIINRAADISAHVRMLEENLQELHNLQNSNSDLNAFVKNDIAFHHILSAACGNIVFETVYNNILEYFVPSIRQSHMNQHDGAISVLTHEQILNAIKHKDLALADEAICSSINYWKSLNS